MVKISPFHDGLDQVRAKAVAQVAVIIDGENEQVSLFARLDRPNPVCHVGWLLPR